MAAFYDDSGSFDPDARRFACFGMNVISAECVRKCGNAWWEMLEGHFRCPASLQTIGIEAKSSELYNMLKRLRKGDELQKVQQRMFNHGLNTVDKVNDLIEAIFDFLAKPPVPTKYLAVVANKEEVWLQFRINQVNRLRTLTQSPDRNSKEEIVRLRKDLSSFLVKHIYEYLLQRLDYLSNDGDFEFSDAFVIGDESTSTKVMLKTQAEIQAGLGKFSLLPAIVNRSWFGSSLHDPCLQMADWIAFSVRMWAEGSVTYSKRIKQLLPNFRGYPKQVVGRGIVLCPNKECFPELPLEEVSV